jgi:hypothetical protein
VALVVLAVVTVVDFLLEAGFPVERVQQLATSAGDQITLLVIAKLKL